MKDEKYTYYATEHSVDVRNYRIESDRQLTQDQIQ